MCDLLNQEVFSPCHEYISPAPFQRQCRADTCKCGTPCLCSALAHYARHCRKFSVIVEFRSHVPDCGECSGLCVICLQRLSYGSTSTQRKGVNGPITSLSTLLASTARAWRAPLNWSTHWNPTQNQNRSRLLRSVCVVLALRRHGTITEP